MARSGARRALGRIARSAAGRDRRSRSRARRQAHRVEPAGRGRYLVPGPAAAGCCARSISPSCASPRPERCAPARRRRGPSRCRMSPGIGVVVSLRRRRRAASAAGGCCRRSATSRGMTICAGAAPMSSTAAPCRWRRSPGDDRPPDDFRGLAVAAVVAVLDQLSKAWVLHFFGETGCAAHYLAGDAFFDLVLTCNTRRSASACSTAPVSARWSLRLPRRQSSSCCCSG